MLLYELARYPLSSSVCWLPNARLSDALAFAQLKTYKQYFQSHEQRDANLRYSTAVAIRRYEHTCNCTIVEYLCAYSH
jgi:hypothetical protein